MCAKVLSMILVLSGIVGGASFLEGAAGARLLTWGEAMQRAAERDWRTHLAAGRPIPRWYLEMHGLRGCYPQDYGRRKSWIKPYDIDFFGDPGKVLRGGVPASTIPESNHESQTFNRHEQAREVVHSADAKEPTAVLPCVPCGFTLLGHLFAWLGDLESSNASSQTEEQTDVMREQEGVDEQQEGACPAEPVRITSEEADTYCGVLYVF